MHHVNDMAVAKLGARGTQSLATLPLWGYLAAAPPDSPTKRNFSGACGPRTPTTADVATAMHVSDYIITPAATLYWQHT
jgi:hypothetical protein